MSTASFNTFTLGEGLSVIESEQLLSIESPIGDLASQIAWDGEYGDGEVFAAGVLVDGKWEVISRGEVEGIEREARLEELIASHPKQA